MTIEEKVNLIIQLCDKHNITAYEIGKETELNTSGVQRILSRDVNKPRNKTLNIILEYIENTIVGSALPEHKNYRQDLAKEEPPTYGHTEKSEILTAIAALGKRLNRNQDIIARSIADLLLDTSEIKEGMSDLSEPLRALVDLHNSKSKISPKGLS